MLRKAALFSLAGVAALVGLVAAPAPAEAWWVRPGWGWRGPVYVVAPPPYFAPRPYFVPPPYPGYGAPAAYWARPHYNRYGYFVPGQWQ